MIGNGIRIWTRAALLTGTATMLATACGATAPEGDAHPDGQTSAPFAHVHGVALDGPALLLATHHGLLRQLGDGPATLAGEHAFDVMAFTLSEGRLLASGHPGPGADLPAALGLRRSTDAGQTWTDVSLLGEVDFHRLQAVGSRVWGIAADDGRLLASVDDGRTWTTLGAPGLFDLAVDPADPSVLVGTSETGLQRSVDGGRTFAAVPGAPVLMLVTWTGSGLYGVTPTGAVLRSSDGRTGWVTTGGVTGEPQALWADGDRVAVVTTAKVSLSEDGGRTFTDRLRLGAHG